MKTSHLLHGTVLVALAIATATADVLTDTLQRGLVAEEADRDLETAIRAYQSVIQLYTAQRQAAATAVFRLGECYRKLGQTNDAITQYRRLLTEFPSETSLVDLSRKNLAALGMESEPTTATESPWKRQAHLLEQELALVEQQLEAKRRQVEVGNAPQSELVALQRETLQLERQLVEVEARGNPPELLTISPEGRLAPLSSVSAAESQTSPVTAEADLLDDEAQALERARTLAATDPERALRLSQFAALKRYERMFTESPDLINAQCEEDPEDKAVKLTPLQWAVAKGYADVAELLLERWGARVNAPDSLGHTALHHSVRTGNLSLTRFLLERAADVNAVSERRRTPLHEAAQKGYLALATALLDAGANPEARDQAGQTPLHLAAKSGNDRVVELLIEKGADVNAVTDDGSTALLYAAATRRPSTVGLLLAKGANPNVAELQKAGGKTPLHYAVAYSHAPIIDLLLEAGADTTSRDTENSTPLDYAVRWGTKSVVAQFLSRKLDSKTLTESLLRMLDGPGGEGDASIVALLLEHGADVNARADVGRTPLHLAAFHGDSEIAGVLLDHGADPNPVDDLGRTPLDYAQTFYNESITISPSGERHRQLLPAIPDAKTAQRLRETTDRIRQGGGKPAAELNRGGDGGSDPGNP